MIEYGEISWIGVTLEGTGITIRIVETIPEAKQVERQIPTDVIATKDGTIISIVASSGTGVVSEGDEVKVGDVLISSMVPLSDSGVQIGEKYVTASGIVYAKCNYELEGIAPLNYNEKTFTGNIKNDYSGSLWGNNINIITPRNDENFEVINDDEITFFIGDYKVPFSISKTVYAKRELKYFTRTEQEALEIAEKQLNDKITALTFETGGELYSAVTETVNDGKNIMVKGYLMISVRIDAQRQLQEIQYEEVVE